MNTTSHIQLDQLRELLLSAEIPPQIRLLAVVAAVALTIHVLVLVRRRRLLEEYSPIWLAAAAGVLVVSLWPGLLTAVARVIGAWSQSSTLYLLALAYLVLMSLGFSVRLSALNRQVKTLGQEMALLRAQVERAEPASEDDAPSEPATEVSRDSTYAS
jgi:hypothetical protein